MSLLLRRQGRERLKFASGGAEIQSPMFAVNFNKLKMRYSNIETTLCFIFRPKLKVYIRTPILINDSYFKK